MNYRDRTLNYSCTLRGRGTATDSSRVLESELTEIGMYHRIVDRCDQRFDIVRDARLRTERRSRLTAHRPFAELALLDRRPAEDHDREWRGSVRIRSKVANTAASGPSSA